MRNGLEILQSKPELAKNWGNCALLCNQASVTRLFETSWDVCRSVLGPRLKAFFGPQHGFHATVQDNMIETGHSLRGPFNLPVYSLYSEVREPSDSMLDGLDTIIVDIQIVGCRVYTFKYTIAGCLRAAKRLGKRVVVLDRPNPLGGEVIEGRVLDPGARSFVGEFEIPLRHGLTVAEAALLFNSGIGADLEVIGLEAWAPKSYWSDFMPQWVLTSPNLPTVDSVYVYPATVMLEGTNISEGRGTGLPFQLIGAPYISDAEAFTKRVLDYHKDPGCFLRSTEFQPTSQKWAGQVCRGFQIHVMDPRKIQTFRLGLSIMRAAYDLAPSSFEWKKPGYEYDFKNLPIDLILGDIGSAEKLMGSFDLSSEYWHKNLNHFALKGKEILKYERQFKVVF